MKLKRSDPDAIKTFQFITLNKNQRLLISILSLILLLTWILTFSKAATQTPIERTLYSYALSTDSAYIVHLLPNDIYSQTALAENAVYTTHLMKDLSVTFTADYQASQPSTMSCTYAVQALVRGYQTIGGTQADVFTKDYQIQAPRTVTQADTSTLDISQNLTIDPTMYNEFSAKAQKQIASSLNREVQIIFTGTFETATENGNISAPFTSVITMPLGSELFTISKTAPIAAKDSISEQQPRSPATNPLFYAWCLLPLAALFLLTMLFFFSRQPNPVEIYNARLKKITRRHRRRMIELAEIPETDHTAVRLKNIRSLIRLAATLRKPLCYISNSAGLPEGGRIYLMDTDYHYYYQETTRDLSQIVPCKLQKIPPRDIPARDIPQRTIPQHDFGGEVQENHR